MDSPLIEPSSSTSGIPQADSVYSTPLTSPLSPTMPPTSFDGSSFGQVDPPNSFARPHDRPGSPASDFSSDHDHGFAPGLFAPPPSPHLPHPMDPLEDHIVDGIPFSSLDLLDGVYQLGTPVAAEEATSDELPANIREMILNAPDEQFFEIVQSILTSEHRLPAEDVYQAAAWSSYIGHAPPSHPAPAPPAPATSTITEYLEELGLGGPLFPANTVNAAETEYEAYPAMAAAWNDIDPMFFLEVPWTFAPVQPEPEGVPSPWIDVDRDEARDEDDERSVPRCPRCGWCASHT